MCKFATFEKAVEAIYAYLGKPKDSYNALQQTGVSFAGGYIAGVACAVISHPADVMVSKLNAEKGDGEGAVKAMGRVYRQIGFVGLWNGLPMRIAMIGTLTVREFCLFGWENGWLIGLRTGLPVVHLRQLQVGSRHAHDRRSLNDKHLRLAPRPLETSP